MNKYKKELKEKKRKEKVKEYFLETLTKNGYRYGKDSYDIYWINGNNIYGFFMFYTENLHKYLTGSLNGYIAIDHKDLYDKVNKCPCILKLPLNIGTMERNTRKIIEHLKYWGSKEGYKNSNKYNCEFWRDERQHK